MLPFCAESFVFWGCCREKLKIKIYNSVILSQLAPQNEEIGHEVPKWAKRRIEKAWVREKEKTNK
jgi:hypothetical protein